jgi:hypothetical protein
MVLHGVQSRRGGQAGCNLLSAQSLPYHLAGLYDHTCPFTSANPSVAGPCIEEVQFWTNSHGPNPSSAPRSRRRKIRLQNADCPMPKGLSMYPVIALIILMLVTWIVAMWASCGENDEAHDEKKPARSSDEQDNRKAALKQDRDRLTASLRLQQKRPCIICEKTCRHAYALRSSDGGPYGL